VASASSGQSFVHLHNHTERSMPDGAAKIDDLFVEAGRMGMPAVATNTLLIAERCHSEFTEGANLMPRLPVPEGGRSS
jgi:DNA polymerase III alpha subunit